MNQVPQWTSTAVSDQIQGVYSNQIQSAYSNQIQSAYSNQIPGVYSNHMQGAYSNPIQSAYSNQIQGFYNNQIQGVYSNQIQGFYNNQIQGVYGNQIHGFYNNQMQGFYNNQIQGFYNNQIQGVYSNQVQGIYSNLSNVNNVFQFATTPVNTNHNVAGAPAVGSQKEQQGTKSPKRPLEDNKESGKGKKMKSKVGTRLKEPEVGITEYIGSHKGFFGTIKERYSDFHVNEIGLDGEITKLTTQEIPSQPEKPDQSIEDLKFKMPKYAWGILQALKHTEEIEIEVTELGKEERKAIHMAAEKMAEVTTQTVEIDGKKFITTKNKTKSTNQRAERNDWSQGAYCYFILHKMNVDTIEALNKMASFLRIKPNNFSYAGTKDRRGWTSQWISLKKTKPKDIYRAGRAIGGVYVGNFKFEKEPLKLGMLRGNSFRIALRNVSGTNEEIETAMNSLKNNGFINYYGLQRFGTVSSIPTHSIGKALLQKKWEEAVKLILQPREDEQDKDLSEARMIYKTTGNPTLAYKKIKRASKVEALLLKGLEKCGKNNFLGALDFIPRNIRLMYMHAYQSYIWNHVVSRRIREFGQKPICGDFVYVNEAENSGLEMQNDEFDEDGQNTAVPIDDSVIAERDNSSKDPAPAYLNVKCLKEEDLEKYKITDIIMPQPGWKITYPPYAKPWYEEYLGKDGLSTTLWNKNKKYSLGGSYRKIVQVPSNLSWEIVHYSGKYDDLINSDIDEITNVRLPKRDAEGQYKALLINMILKSSTYATMALREILKSDTSAESQSTQISPEN